MKKFKRDNRKKTKKESVKNEKSLKKWKSCEKLIRKISLRQSVYGKCLSGFVHFSKKYIWEMSVRGHAFKVLTVNRFFTCLSTPWQGFAHFSKKYTREMSIWGHAFEVFIVNRFITSISTPWEMPTYEWQNAASSFACHERQILIISLSHLSMDRDQAPGFFNLHISAKFLQVFKKTVAKFFRIPKFRQKLRNTNFCTPLFFHSFSKFLHNW